MTTPLPDDHQQLARWLRGEDEVPNDAELLRHLSGKTWDVPVPTLLGHRWGWPPKGTWLHASVVQVMTMLHDEDLQGMAPAVHMVHALLDAGASPNIQDAAGRTPLHELFERLPARLNAGSNWLAGIVQALLNAHADPRIEDHAGHPAPLSRAVREANTPWMAWWNGHPNPKIRACVAPLLTRCLDLERAAICDALSVESGPALPPRPRL